METQTPRELASLFITTFIIIGGFGGLYAAAMQFVANPFFPPILKIVIVFCTIVFGMIVIGRGFFLEEVYERVVS